MLPVLSGIGGKLRGNLIEATRRILQSLLVNSDAFIEANGKLREREKEFIDSVKEITAAMLFRGHLGDEGYHIGTKGEMEAEWSDIASETMHKPSYPPDLWRDLPNSRRDTEKISREPVSTTTPFVMSFSSS